MPVTVNVPEDFRAFVRQSMPAYGDGKSMMNLSLALGMPLPYLQSVRNGQQKPKFETLFRILAVTRPRVRLALIENEAA